MQAVTMEDLLTQPSFSEFVDWLVQNRAGKENTPVAWAEENAWLPYYAVCPVCQLPYTVLKLEEPGEMQELMKQVKLKLPHWATPVHTIGGKSSSASKATRYMSHETYMMQDNEKKIHNFVLGISQNSHAVKLNHWQRSSAWIYCSSGTIPR